ncbi:MAG: type II secretion system protein [Pseudomonadota bacterium]
MVHLLPGRLQPISTRGFTLLELLVSMGVFVALLTLSLAALKTQGEFAAQSVATKDVDESIRGVQSTLQYDIMNAGSGLYVGRNATTRAPKLAIYADKYDWGATDNGIQLMLNWSGFLDYDVDPTGSRLPVSTIFLNEGDGSLGWFRVSGGTFQIDPITHAVKIPDRTKTPLEYGEFGGLIGLVGSDLRSASARALSYDHNDFSVGWPATPLSLKPIGANGDRLIFTISSGSYDYAVPAIEYRWNDKEGRLFRNGVAILGDEPHTTGTRADVGKDGKATDSFFIVTDFDVMFTQSSVSGTTSTYSAKNGEMTKVDFDYLQRVKVIISYKWKTPGMEKPTKDMVKEIEVAPRSIVYAIQGGLK